MLFKTKSTKPSSQNKSMESDVNYKRSLLNMETTQSMGFCEKDVFSKEQKTEAQKIQGLKTMKWLKRIRQACVLFTKKSDDIYLLTINLSDMSRERLGPSVSL